MDFRQTFRCPFVGDVDHTWEADTPGLFLQCPTFVGQKFTASRQLCYMFVPHVGGDEQPNPAYPEPHRVGQILGRELAAEHLTPYDKPAGAEIEELYFSSTMLIQHQNVSWINIMPLAMHYSHCDDAQAMC